MKGLRIAAVALGVAALGGPNVQAHTASCALAGDLLYAYSTTPGATNNRWRIIDRCADGTSITLYANANPNFCAVPPISGTGTGSVGSHAISFSWSSDGISWIAFNGGVTGTLSMWATSPTIQSWCAQQGVAFTLYGDLAHT